MKQLKYNLAQFSILNVISELGLGPGDRIPPERELVEKLDCSIITMRKALQQMQKQKIIESKRGSGNFLRKKIDSANILGRILRISLRPRNKNWGGDVLGQSQQYLMDYGFELINVTTDSLHNNLINLARSCSGIILTGYITADFVERVKLINLPVIICGNYNIITDIPIISLDFEASAYRLTRFFIESGHTKICIFAGAHDYLPGKQQIKGYIKAMNEAGLAYQNYMPENTVRFKSYEQIAHFMEKCHDGIDAVIMEQSSVEAFFSWCWKNDYPHQPAIGVTQAVVYNIYQQNDKFMWSDFENINMFSAKALLKHILYGETMESRVLPPVIHGVDDSNKSFINYSHSSGKLRH